MANGSSLRRAVVAASLVASFVSVAGAAEVKELGQIDMSRPVPAGTCVADSASGKAYDKIEALKKARGQYNVIEANSVSAKSVKGNGLAEIVFTSNLKASSEVKGLRGEGYVVTSNTPKGQHGTTYCIENTNDITGITSVITGTKVPALVNKGDIGVALTNEMNRANSKVAFVAVTDKKTLFAVTFNYDTKEGGYTTADGAGGNILPIALIDVDYSLSLPPAIQKALGLSSERMALAHNSPKPQ